MDINSCSPFPRREEHHLSHSGEDQSYQSIPKVNSFLFDRRAFENPYLPNAITKEKVTVIETHRNCKSLPDALLQEIEDKRPKKSLSVPSKDSKKIKPSKLNFSDEDKDRKVPHLRFKDRELIQPITSPTKANSEPERKSYLKNFDRFQLIDKNKKDEFNNSIYKQLIKHLKSEDYPLKAIPPVHELREQAKEQFDLKLKEVTLERFAAIEKVPCGELFHSELIRAKSALVKLQKEARLIKEIATRLKFLQNALYKLIENQFEKKSKKNLFKSEWTEQFFIILNDLIESYTLRKREMNPLKTFTHRFEENLKDQKMKELITLCLKIEKKELDLTIELIKEWAHFEFASTLKKRVQELDREAIEKSLNLSTKNILNQKHEWYESLESKTKLSKNRVEEIIRCMIPEGEILYKEIKVNDRLIFSLKSENKEESQIEFFKELLQEIYNYSSNFTSSTHLKKSENQAYLLVNIEKCVRMIEEDLKMHEIPWDSIQNKLSCFKALPFSKFKNEYDPNIHLNISHFLLEISIPCLEILLLCTHDCWLKADECIRMLFGSLFSKYGAQKGSSELHTILDKGIECHIQIQNKENFSVSQIKKYVTTKISHHSSNHLSSSDDKSKIATTTFKWTVSPYFDEKKNLRTWKGILEILDIIIHDEMNEDLKEKTLKIFNNPEIIDYVSNEINGKPKIISNS